jgi:hypothetical protein
LLLSLRPATFPARTFAASKSTPSFAMATSRIVCEPWMQVQKARPFLSSQRQLGLLSSWPG